MSDSIDDLINEVAAQMEQQTTDVAVTEEQITDVVNAAERTENDLVELTLKKNEVVDNMADKAFQMFFDGLSRGTDHTSASKEQMVELLKVKTELNKTIVELAKLKKKQDGSKLGIMINTMNPSQAGIDIDKIKNSLQES